MKRLAAFFLWLLVFLALLFGVDQFLMRVDVPLPVLTEVRTFYVDFRSRLFELVHRAPSHPHSGDGRTAGKPPSPQARKAPVKAPGAEASAPRYLYADAQGELHFADSLDEVPAAYRKDAQPLKR